MWTVKRRGLPKASNAVAINSEIYFFDINNFEKDAIKVYVFYPASHCWQPVKTQSITLGTCEVIFASNMAAYGDCAYVCSWIPEVSNLGCNVYRFDTRTKTWSCPEVYGDKPDYLCRSACVTGQRLYIIGSKRGDCLQDIHFLDLDTYKWHRVRTSGVATTRPRGAMACAIGSRIYVWGGSAGKNSVFYLDTVTSTWVRPDVEGVAPECRSSYSVFVYKGEMYIFGGYNRELGILFADLHKYDPHESCWTQVRPMRSGPCARMRHASCVMGDRVFVFGGRGLNPSRGGQSTGADRELVPLRRFAEKVLTDLYVLDFAPTLRTLCLLAVRDAGVAVGEFPEILMEAISAMTDDDSTSNPS